MLCFAQGLSGMMPMLITMGAIFIIFYMLMIRPQKKKEQERRAMIEAIKKNDEVVTIGGIHGVVTGLREDEVTLKVDEASNVKLRMARSAISRVVSKSGSPDDKDDDRDKGF